MTAKLISWIRKYRLWIGISIPALALAVFLVWRERPSPLTSLGPKEFDRVFSQDARRYLDLDAGLERAVSFLESSKETFEKGAEHALTPDEEKELLEVWASVFDQGFALDQIRLFHEDWYRFDPAGSEQSFHLRSFLLTFAAELSLYEKSSRLVSLIAQNRNAVRFLDAPHPEKGLDEASFSRFRRDLQGLRDGARYRGGQIYLAALEKLFGGKQRAQDFGCAWLWQRVESHLAKLGAISDVELAKATLGSDFQWVRRGLRRVWFPVQSKTAEWMGDTKLRRLGNYLVSSAQIEEMDRRLEPGDILLSRKNWYLSNVGLPGFWPHAILYLGDPRKFESYFAELEGPRPGEILRERWPELWTRYEQGIEGKPVRVLEAISEGVSLNSFEHAAGDYLVALRPRLPKSAKAQAVVQAFSYLDRPYDFDFDFATDHALVCTEVVWRSYRPASGKPGLEFPLVDVLRRKTLPANEIARIFVEQRGRPEAQLDFVYFLDAKEKEKRAFISTEEEFARSYLRAKWDIVQD